MSKGNIVFIHGMWGSEVCWENYRVFFSELGYTCHTPTLPGHGGTQGQADHSLASLGLADYYQFMTAYIGKLPEKPIIIGHSMGALIAQQLAAKQLSCATIALTPAPSYGVFGITPSVFRIFSKILFSWAFWRKTHRLSFANAGYAMLHKLSDTDQKKAYATMGAESGRAIFEIGYWMLDRHKASAVNSQQVHTPMLIIGAVDDRITPISVVRRTAKKFAKADYHEFSNHAHWVIGQPNWQDIAMYCESWLDKQQLG